MPRGGVWPHTNLPHCFHGNTHDGGLRPLCSKPGMVTGQGLWGPRDMDGLEFSPRWQGLGPLGLPPSPHAPEALSSSVHSTPPTSTARISDFQPPELREGAACPPSLWSLFPALQRPGSVTLELRHSVEGRGGCTGRWARGRRMPVQPQGASLCVSGRAGQEAWGVSLRSWTLALQTSGPHAGRGWCCQHLEGRLRLQPCPFLVNSHPVPRTLLVHSLPRGQGYPGAHV